MVTVRNPQVIPDTFNIISISTTGHCPRNCSPHLFLYISFMTRQPLMSQGLLTVEAPRSYSDTSHGRTPLDEWSVRRRYLYLTTHNTYEQISMPPVGFEPAVPASEQQQTDALHRAATGTGSSNLVIIVSYGSMLIPVVTCFIKRTVTVCATNKILFCSEVPATDNLNFWQEEYRTILHPSRLDKGFIIGILAALSMYYSAWGSVVVKALRC